MKLDGAPLADVVDVLDQSGIAMQRDEQIASDEMILAASERSAPVMTIFESIRTRTQWGRRFEACRGLGHALCDPLRAGSLGAGSGPYARGNRRRRSGAFAAELLLPDAAMATMSDRRLDGLAEEARFAELLQEYGLGARAAAYQLWNRGWLSSSVVRDGLIDRFAASQDLGGCQRPWLTL
jgi:Zn-dependent peptidase ImmA (M78 family)